MSTTEPSRQAPVDRYGLAPAHGEPMVDDGLQFFAAMAQRMMRADFGALHILDRQCQIRIAAWPGVPLDVSRRPPSRCQRVLDTAPLPKVLVTADASHDVLMFDPYVTGELGAVRYYAAAPLIGTEGFPIGLLCVWPEVPAPVQNPSGEMLRQIADEVMATIHARR